MFMLNTLHSLKSQLTRTAIVPTLQLRRLRHRQPQQSTDNLHIASSYTTVETKFTVSLPLRNDEPNITMLVIKVALLKL